MKKYLILPGLIIIFLMVQCAGSKPLYELPAEMREDVKAEYATQCEQGQVLYQLNCAKCHTTKKGRKEIIPDFTSQQLRGYELRITNNQHETNLTDESCSEEDLAKIMVFLRYKKKNPTEN